MIAPLRAVRRPVCARPETPAAPAKTALEVAIDEFEPALRGAAKFIDRAFGDRNQRLSIQELQRFADMYGADRTRNGVISPLAARLGWVATTDSEGRVSLQADQRTWERAMAGATTRLPISESTAEPTSAAQLARALASRAGAATPEDVQKVIAALTRLPLSVLRALQAKGVLVSVCHDTVTEHCPDLKGQHPRGKPPGTTWDDVQALHNRERREIVFAVQGYPDECERLRELAHEVGHALDNLAGDACLQDDFQKYYRYEIGALSLNGDYYLLLDGNAGPEEAFAESFGRFIAYPDRLAKENVYFNAYWQRMAELNYSPLGV